jgi:hypothetical protein
VSRQSFVASDITDFPPSSHTAVANTTSRTNLWVPSLWTPIAAFDPKPGKAYLLRCGGTVSTTGTPTIQFTAAYGQSATPASNLSLGTTTALPLATITGRVWHAEFVFGFRSIGIAASGSSAVGTGFVSIDNGAGVVGVGDAMGGTVVTTADHTTAQGLVLDVTWSAASASNTITCLWTMLQSLN